MNKKNERIRWVLEKLADLAEFSEEFRSYCEEKNLDDGKIFELELSLEELIVNSFTHGYKSNEDGTVTVEFEDTGHEIRISMRDKAPPFDLFRDAPAPRLGGEDPDPEVVAELEPDSGPGQGDETEPKQEKEGGLGIHLVKSLNDKVEYYGSKDGNIVVIIKSKS